MKPPKWRRRAEHSAAAPQLDNAPEHPFRIPSFTAAAATRDVQQAHVPSHTHSHTATLGTSVCACNLHTSPANLHKCLGICIYFLLYKEGLLCWRVLLGLTIFTIAAFRYLNNPSNGKFISIQISCRVTGEITCSQHPHQPRV